MEITFYCEQANTEDPIATRWWFCPPRVGDGVYLDSGDYKVISVSWADTYSGDKPIKDKPCAAVDLEAVTK